jgi:hypothetical protein
MLFIGGLVSVVLVALIAYLALSPASSRLVRRAAIIALVLIGLAAVACSITLLLLLVFPSAAKGAVGRDIPLVPRKNESGDFFPIVIFLGALLITLVVVIALALREQDRKRR